MRVPGITADPARGARIRELRKRAGLSQEELGQRCGVTKWSVGNWESGDPIQKGNLRTLAEELGSTVEYVLDGVDPEPADSPDRHISEVSTRVSRLEVDVNERLDDLAGRVAALAQSVEELLLGQRPLGQEDEQPPEADAPPGQT